MNNIENGDSNNADDDKNFTHENQPWLYESNFKTMLINILKK